MAVTVITQPQDYTPAYNEMVFTASSTNVANVQFSYLVDVYVNGSSTFTRLRIAPEPTGNFCVADISKIIESYISSDLFNPNDTAPIIDCNNSVVSYDVHFGEEYEVAGVLTQFPGLTNVTGLHALNIALPYVDWIDFLPSDYNALDSNSRPLSNAPKTKVVGLNDAGYMYLLDELGATSYMIVTTYNALGVVEGQYNIDVNTYSGKVIRVPTHPYSLNNVIASAVTVIQGFTPIITSNVTNYKIEILNGTNVVCFQPQYYNVRDCGAYTRLIWLNRLGGYDSFNFYGRSTNQYNIDRKEYKRQPQRLNTSTGAYSYATTDKEQVQYLVNTSESMLINSDWLTEEEDKWLLELIESPDVYMQVGYRLIAVTKIKQTNHKLRKHITDKIFLLELELELNKSSRQRG